MVLLFIYLLLCKYISKKLIIINVWYFYSKDCIEINYMVGLI